MLDRSDMHWWWTSQRPRRATAKTGRPVLRYSRRLRLEPLEDRRLLTITVNTLVDENNGIGVGAGTSLREALFSALDGESIDFSVTGTINLTNLGHLVINKNLTVNGPGAGLLTINAFDPTPDMKNGDGSRVFFIDDGNVNTQISVELNDIALTGGDVAGPGGAIFSAENLTVRNSIISGNAALVGGTLSFRSGGGIYQLAGDLTVMDSTVSNNVAGFQGGGIFTNAGNLTLLRSTISDNTVTGSSSVGGGGIRAGAATITASTVHGNSAPDGGGMLTFGTVTILESTVSGNNSTEGGGITQSQGNLTLESSTISGNTTLRNGGGIRSLSGNLTIRHSTLTGNGADSDDNSSGRGGGLFVGSSVVTLDHALVAGNIRRVNIREDIFGSVSVRYSLVGDTSGATITNTGLNLLGIAGVPIDPLLGPLADNGGPVHTHTLFPGSPAIDRGDPYAVAGTGGVPLYDQRGESFERVINGDGPNGARIDIGAFEVQSVVEPPALLGDYNEDGAVDAGDYTVWRDALGQIGVAPYSGADGSGNGSIGLEDHLVWKSQFGQTTPPPPGSGNASEQGAESGEEGTAAASLLTKPVAPDRLPLVLAEIEGREMVRDLRAWIRPSAELGDGAISRAVDTTLDIGLMAWLAALGHDEGDFRGGQCGESADHESASSAEAADEEFALLGELTVGLGRYAASDTPAAAITKPTLRRA